MYCRGDSLLAVGDGCVASHMTVGVISDTHGLLRPEAIVALMDCELIVHAGDVGNPEILERLRAIAPTVAVRGNVDTSAWAMSLPLTEVVAVGDLQLYMLHDLAQLDLDPKAAGFAAVISGHTHRPVAETRNGVLYLNPGSAGPRRFRLPTTVARLEVAGSRLSHHLIELHQDRSTLTPGR
jgi:putative phosphoesterase